MSNFDGTQADPVTGIAADYGMKQDSGFWRHRREAFARLETLPAKHQEFPPEYFQNMGGVSRRAFLRTMGASTLLGGLAACARQPEEKIVPYVKPPEERVEGRPQYYATAMPLGGYGVGVLATTYDGRPTKLDGLAEHPSSRGMSDLFIQASLLDLYDPDRLSIVQNAGTINTWQRFTQDLLRAVTLLPNGKGLHILAEPSSSPTLAWQRQQILEKYPEARWYAYSPLARDSHYEGTQLAFGHPAEAVYDLSKAKVIVSLDANFLVEGPGRIVHAKDFADGRDPDINQGGMNRLYVIETLPTLTGAAADHVVRVRYAQVEAVARALAAALQADTVSAPSLDEAGVPKAWFDALVEDLQAAQGAVAIIPGEAQPAVVHYLAHLINTHLGAPQAGTVRYIEAVLPDVKNSVQSLKEFVQAVAADTNAVALVLGGNPVYDAPADIKVGDALKAAAFSAHLTSHFNETSAHCLWVLPQAHYLEAWSDIRGHDGTASIVQPTILPLYGGKSIHELLSVLLGQEQPSYDVVRAYWKTQWPELEYESRWRSALAAGIVRDSSIGAIDPVVQKGKVREAMTVPGGTGLDIRLALDPHVLDGRYTNCSWLQELPKPLSLLTWDNAVFLHPSTAKQYHVEEEDLVEIEVSGRVVRGPVLLLPGQPKGTAAIFLGYGREICGVVGKGRGFNAYPLRTSSALWNLSNATLRKVPGKYMLARTEEHWNIEKTLPERSERAEIRHLVRTATLAQFKKDPLFAKHMGHEEPSREETLYHPDEKVYMRDEGYAWAMTIDLNRCIGCGVCTIACQAENNIPVVGKEHVRRGREMHWIRIDRYYRGDFYGTPEVVHQPVPCMQCENAPCEPVCPVGATQHSKEGLNDMVYNRCIGTRYCANNCPYKVRRFNFFKYADHETPQLKMMRNPHVSVRGRGVMEKCTYCVQRINRARQDAKRDGRVIRDGEILTACQVACPTRAIVFGNKNDKQSLVAGLSAHARAYRLLADLGTRPRTTYLAKLTNPSEKLVSSSSEQAHGAHKG
jgi:molybdopterin-containing oxidoreductase family iron-sulfur binding subunit